IVGKRAQILHQLEHSRLDVVVTAARGYAQPALESVVGREPNSLREQGECALGEVVRGVEFRAYTRVDMVAKRGEFAVRGGIIDIFPTTLDYPVRVEFWGDEVTDIRQFSIADQRTIPEIEVGSVEIFPARDLPITDAIAQRAETLAVKHTGNAALVELLSKVSQRMASEGMEALLPVLSDAKMVPLTDFMPEGTHVVLVAPEKIRTRIADLESTDAEFMAAGWEAAA